MAHCNELREMPMNHLIEQVLPFRNLGYLATFCEKLLAQGIATPPDLLGTTRTALETKLSKHESFKFMDLAADTLSLGSAIDSEQKSADALVQRRCSEKRRQRSRSSKNHRCKNDRRGQS